jgi:fumarylacetoacetate (FAA) hydrolase
LKLCRFRLQDDPGPRTGIFHDGQYYETDGQNALGVYRPDDVSLLAPILQPPSIRDFMAFEDHVLNTRKRFGKESVQAEWYEAPAFFFMNPASVIGPDATVQKPDLGEELDFELEVGVVISESASDIDPTEADRFILGFTIVNDWSLRDVQRSESKVGLGYAKGKDFATSVGPYLVTPDELEKRIVDNSSGNRYDLAARAYVNDDVIGTGNIAEMRWTFAGLIARASLGTRLSAGDLIASGCVGSCCLLENGREYLTSGDEVTLEVDILGFLRNRIV